VVPHLATNWAISRLSAQIGRDAEFSRFYGRGYFQWFKEIYKPTMIVTRAHRPCERSHPVHRVPRGSKVILYEVWSVQDRFQQVTKKISGPRFVVFLRFLFADLSFNCVFGLSDK
jgi:hypothetical protein